VRVFHCADIGAFKPADKIQHSPPAGHVTGTAAAVSATLSSLSCVDEQTEFNYGATATVAGPLSSTLLDVSDHSSADVEAMDTVVMKLFTQLQPDG